MITVIIVNFFSSNDLRLTLDSLKHNRCFGKTDIHVVDNSNNHIEHEALKVLQQNSPFTLHDIKQNIGFARACNHVYKQTNGRYVLLINPDAYLINGALDSLLEQLETDTNLAAAGPKIFWNDQLDFILPQSINSTPFSFYLHNYPHSLTKKLLWFKSLLFRKSSINYWLSSNPLAQKNLSGGSVLLRRKQVDKAGGLFDPQFFMYYEDTDLFTRLRKKNYKLMYVPKAQIVHKFSGCAREQQALKNDYMAQSAAQFLSKHYPENKLIEFTHNASGKTQGELWSPRLIDFDEQDKANDITIHLNKQTRYLIEWSPSPYFLPAAGKIFTEQVFKFPEDIWDILPNGHQYLRIAPLNTFWVKPEIWHWIKV